MALSTMNWNNAQLDERDPLTLRHRRRLLAGCTVRDGIGIGDSGSAPVPAREV